MKAISIDLETLSLANNAAIVSIGICAFDETEIIDTAHLILNMKEVFGDISASTVAWWMGQSPAAQQQTFNPETKPLSQMQAALKLKEFCDLHAAAEEVWANDPSFDLVVLRNWWQALPKQISYTPGKFPFDYRNERSIRTIRAVGRIVSAQWADWTGEAHNALDDAMNQARLVQAVWSALRNPEPRS